MPMIKPGTLHRCSSVFIGGERLFPGIRRSLVSWPVLELNHREFLQRENFGHRYPLMDTDGKLDPSLWRGFTTRQGTPRHVKTRTTDKQEDLYSISACIAGPPERLPPCPGRARAQDLAQDLSCLGWGSALACAGSSAAGSSSGGEAQNTGPPDPAPAPTLARSTRAVGFGAFLASLLGCITRAWSA
jgi:hypothetical protein